jgi:hypothetical protein
MSVTDEASELGVRLEVLALRVDRGERLTEREIARTLEDVSRVGATLTPDRVRWLHERVQRVVDSYASARDALAARAARVGQGRRAVRGYAAVGGRG